MIESTNQFKAVQSVKEVTVTDCFKTRQTWRRATLEKKLTSAGKYDIHL
jgi:hypothetical protein